MSDLSIFRNYDNSLSKITSHRKIVDAFPINYFETAEFQEDIMREYNPSETDIDALKLGIKTMYFMSLHLVLGYDIHSLQKIELPKVLKKMKRDLLKSIPNDIGELPPHTSDEFFRYMINFGKVDQRSLINTISGLNWRSRSDLLSSVQHSNIIKFNQIIDSCDCDLTNVFKLAYCIHLINNLEIKIHELYEKGVSSVIDNTSSEDILNEKIKNLEERASSSEELGMKEFLMQLDIEQFRLGVLKHNFEKFLSELLPFMKKLVIEKIPPKSYERYQELVIPREVEEYFELLAENAVPDLVDADNVNDSTSTKLTDYKPHQNEINIEKLRCCFTDEFFTKDYAFINSDPIRTYFDEFLLQLQKLIYDKKTTRIDYWRLAHMIARSKYFDKTKYQRMSGSKRRKFSFGAWYEDFCDYCGSNKYNPQYRKRKEDIDKDLLDDFLLILPSK